MIIEKIKTKTLVRKSGVSLFSWGEVTLNPYQGCYHNCSYCDGYSEGYYMHDDFSERIKVKTNAPYLFEQFLKKEGFIPINREKTSTLMDYIPSLKEKKDYNHPPKYIIFLGGGVCDVYQPAEKEIKLTRKLLQVAYDYSMPVFILTKNAYVLRDLDILKKINEDTYACVNFTITLADEDAQKAFEPRASTSQERFEAIKKLREEGIHSGVFFYPTLPFIGDKEENIKSIYQQAKNVGAEFIYCWGLTLKPGRNKRHFFNSLEKYNPDLLPKYERLYGNNDKYGNWDYEQFKELGLIMPEVLGYRTGYKLGINYTAERYVPEGRIETNLKLSELFIKIAYLKRSILHNTQSEVKRFSEAVKFFETFQKDISKLSDEEIRKFPISRHVLPYAVEYIEEKKSHYLDSLEKKSYEYVCNLLK
ncbi:MAG: radical SAM protein [Candidatus Heimdallarchaeota archaeon]|nr:radical SAM protein [Candidatus Heimdallarchaeota archaeon]MCK4878942.1 radical SAM protein [Candidatus Heimdallarchaeota archaeon]